MIEAWLNRLPFSRLKNTLTGRVLVNAGWASAATPITLGLGIIQTGMMARMLGPQGVGALALFAATCALMGGFLKINSAEVAMVYVTQAITSDDRARAGHIIRYCYRVDFLSAILAFGAIVVSSLFLPRLFNLTPGQEWLQAVFGLTLVFQSPYWMSHSLLRVANCFSWTFYQSVTHSVFKLVAVALLYMSKAGLMEVVLVTVGFSLLDGLTLFILAQLSLRRMKIQVDGSIGPWWNVPVEIRRFQGLGYGKGIIKMLYNQLDVLMIGYFANVTSAGIFRSARLLTDSLNIPAQALVTSLSPEYSRLWFSGEVDRLRRLVWRFSLLLLAICGVSFVVAVMLADTVIRIVFGEAFLSAREPFIILILATIIPFAMAPLNSMQSSTGDAVPSTVAGVVTVVSQAVLMLILVPVLGISGAAWARLGAALTAAFIMLPTGVRKLRRPALRSS